VKRKFGWFVVVSLFLILITGFLWGPKFIEVFERVQESNINVNGSNFENEPFNNYTSRSVVYVLVESVNGTSKVTSQGSGVIVGYDAEDFYVLTNHHLFETLDGFEVQSIKIVDYLNNNYYAESVISNQLEEIASVTYDLSLLKIKRIDTEIYEAFKSRITIIPGSIVHSIGYPQNERSFTSGTFLQMERSYGLPFDLIAHDSYLNKGSSGGALLDKNGDLIGINVRVLYTPETEEFYQGYAIPLEKIEEYLGMFNLRLEERT
jgi:S1-C subfamily serine protease